MAAKTAVKTLWVGDLELHVDEATLKKYFEPNGRQIVSVKMMRDKNAAGGVSGYAFVEFQTHDIAEQILETHNGKPIPAAPGKVYRLNWAQYGGVDTPAMRALNTGQQHAIFVGDVPAEATDQILEDLFRDEYGDAVINAKVMTDLTTGRSKGFGFVRFTSDDAAAKAIVEMQGKYLLNRRMRLSGAARKTFAGAADAPFSPDATTVYIGNLSITSEEELKQYFRSFGDITRVKIVEGKSCAFLDFFNRSSAEAAISQMNGAIIGGLKIRMSWGHTGSAGGPAPPTIKTPTAELFKSGAFAQQEQMQEQQRQQEMMEKAMQQWYAQYAQMWQEQLKHAEATKPPEPMEETPTTTEPELDGHQRYVRARLKEYAQPAMAARLNNTVPWL